jgi:hypothetical protein
MHNLLLMSSPDAVGKILESKSNCIPILIDSIQVGFQVSNQTLLSQFKHKEDAILLGFAALKGAAVRIRDVR